MTRSGSLLPGHPQGAVHRAAFCHLPVPPATPQMFAVFRGLWFTNQFPDSLLGTCFSRQGLWLGGPSVPRLAQAWAEKPSKHLMTKRQRTQHSVVVGDPAQGRDPTPTPPHHTPNCSGSKNPLGALGAGMVGGDVHSTVGHSC